MIIDHLPGRTILLNNEEHLFFSGTSYLGVGHQPLFREALMEGIGQYGTIFSASRNNNLKLKIYEEAEDFIAQWTGAEAALTVTSGLLAGQLVVQSLDYSTKTQASQHFIYAPSVHPAIWRDVPPQYSPRHKGSFKNYLDFSKKIVRFIESVKRPVVVCCNTVDPLRCEPYDFTWITQLPDNQDITLVFDDSHGIGITGIEGAGFLSKPDINAFIKSIKHLHRIKIIVVASMAKALGIPGGVILSDKKTIESIRHNPLFVGASPIVPAYLFAFLKTQNTYQLAREQLFFNIQLFKNLAQKNFNEGTKKVKLSKNTCLLDRQAEGVRLKTFDMYPVFFANKNDLYNYFLKHKILISSFSYPNPTDPPITRIIISALHQSADVECLATLTNDFLVNK